MKRLFRIVDLFSILITNVNELAFSGNNKYRCRKKLANPVVRNLGHWHCLRLEELEDRRLLATWNVNTTADVTENSWSTIDNIISLREAIGRANAGDTINFASSLKGKTIMLNGSHLAVTKAVNIDASSLWNSTTNSPGLTINANKLSRVFFISDGNNADSINVKISGLKITGGKSNSGGAIYVSFDNLTMKDCFIVGNVADNSGGGICIIDGTHLLTNCSFTNNSAIYGGGIYNDQKSDLTLSLCTISNNSASNGGGIGNNQSNVTIGSSRFSNNVASSLGAGLYNYGNSTTIITVIVQP